MNIDREINKKIKKIKNGEKIVLHKKKTRIGDTVIISHISMIIENGEFLFINTQSERKIVSDSEAILLLRNHLTMDNWNPCINHKWTPIGEDLVNYVCSICGASGYSPRNRTPAFTRLSYKPSSISRVIAHKCPCCKKETIRKNTKCPECIKNEISFKRYQDNA